MSAGHEVQLQHSRDVGSISVVDVTAVLDADRGTDR